MLQSLLRANLSTFLSKKVVASGLLACIMCSGQYCINAPEAYAELTTSNMEAHMVQNLSISELLKKANNAYESGDHKNTFQYTKLAAEKGSPEGQLYLAWCYELGIGTEVDMHKAFTWYQASAEQNYAVSQFNLAQMYRSGKGVEKSEMYFLAWLMKSAKGGYALAQLNLGWCYSTGYAVKVDKKQAYLWYLKAALQGDPVAQYNLATAYQYGEGTEQDIDEAIRWYSLAADQGCEDAMTVLQYIPKMQ